MSRQTRYWVWVFGEIAGLRWVLDHQVMAFPASASSRIRGMEPGDQAVLYVTRGAFHNPTRDAARLAGLATVLGEPSDETTVEIGDRAFRWTVPIEIEARLPERTGPEVRPLVPRLSFVRKPDAWGHYFRASPLGVSEADFRVLADAVTQEQQAGAR